MFADRFVDPALVPVPLFHFTDEVNVDSILNLGLLSTLDLAQQGVAATRRGSNGLSRYLDRLKGIDGYVHLSLTEHHPLAYVACSEGRIGALVNLRISPEVIRWEGVRGCRGVANSQQTVILPIAEVLADVDLGVLRRENLAMSCAEFVRYDEVRRIEVLVPDRIPPHLIEVAS